MIFGHASRSYPANQSLTSSDEGYFTFDGHVFYHLQLNLYFSYHGHEMDYCICEGFSFCFILIEVNESSVLYKKKHTNLKTKICHLCSDFLSGLRKFILSAILYGLDIPGGASDLLCAYS